MEIAQAIKKRRTIHVFSKKIVSNEIIKRSIVAANQAPCHRRTFPWRFTSLGKNKRELLLELRLSLKFSDKTIDKTKYKKIREKFLNPSHLLVATQVCSNNKLQKLEDYAACACAIQNLSLSLVGDGVGYKWSTGKITTDPNTYQIVEIDSSEEEIIGFLLIGYGTEPSSITRPLLNTIYRERD